MAIVLPDQQNIDLLIFLVKLVIALGTIAIALLLLFWLRLKKLEKRIYLGRKQLKSRYRQNAPQKSRGTQIYSQTPRQRHVARNSLKRSAKFRWRWLLAIAIACITGTAIAIFQLGNSLISPEFMPFIWLLIGITLVVGATFARE